MCPDLPERLVKGLRRLVLNNGLTPQRSPLRKLVRLRCQWQASTISLYKSKKQVAGSKIVIYEDAYYILGR